MQDAPSVDAPLNTKVYSPPPAVQPPRPDGDRSRRKRIEARFVDAESRSGVKLTPPPDTKTGRKMKHRTVAAWKRGAQARTISAAGRELVEELIDTAGPLDHRYADGRVVAVLYVGQRTLADRMGLTVRGVQARMRALVEAGIIARERRAQGRNSFTVVELLTAPEPRKSQDLPRRTYPCATDAHTPVPPSHTPLCESSSSGSSSSDKIPLRRNDYDSESSLSGAHDAAAGGGEKANRTEPPPQRYTASGVRPQLIALGVNPQTLLTMEANHPTDVLAAVVIMVLGMKLARPNAAMLKSEKSTGAWIGSILLKCNSIPAWVRDELEKLDDPKDRFEWALNVLDQWGMIAEREYADR